MLCIEVSYLFQIYSLFGWNMYILCIDSINCVNSKNTNNFWLYANVGSTESGYILTTNNDNVDKISFIIYKYNYQLLDLDKAEAKYVTNFQGQFAIQLFVDASKAGQIINRRAKDKSADNSWELSIRCLSLEYKVLSFVTFFQVIRQRILITICSGKRAAISVLYKTYMAMRMLRLI